MTGWLARLWTVAHGPQCRDCGGDHWIDTSLPSETWNCIATPDTVLCARCIDARLVKAGLTAEAEFYFVGESLRSRQYSESYGCVAAAFREGQQARNNELIARFQRWQDTFPGEMVPWQVMFVGDDPPTQEALARAREWWAARPPLTPPGGP